MRLPLAVPATRLVAHVTLAAALSAPMAQPPRLATAAVLGVASSKLVSPRMAAAAPPPAAAQVLSLVDAGTPRSSPELIAAVTTLLDSAAPPAAVNFAEAAGTWRVVSAPLIDTLSSLALTSFDIQYRIGAGGTVGATVRYDSKLVGDGWLCTDGTIANDANAKAPTVRLIWERIWWQPGGEATAPPLDPDADGAAAFKPIVQVCACACTQ